jgi:bacteriorhodopsin
MSILNQSAIGSLIIQAITGIVEYTGLGFKVNPEDEVVKDILRVELLVQVVEFIFYMYLVYKILHGYIDSDITSHRYFDWMITTPVMLVNFAVFFKYLKNPKEEISYTKSIQDDSKPLLYLVIANAFMLLFGYLGEIGIFNINISTAIGFIPFAFIFKQLYSNFVGSDSFSQILFYFTFAVWGLYGVAAVLPFQLKNTFYNVLDLFAKNAFGLFLYFYIRTIHV